MTYKVEGKTFTKSKEAMQYAKAMSIAEHKAVEIKRSPVPYKSKQYILSY